MDAATMRKGIAAIRPFFPRMALAATPEELRDLGLEAEKAMLEATGGVNTHRGAIFALGLALHALCGGTQVYDNEKLIQSSLSKMAGKIIHNQLKDNTLSATPSALHDARAMARNGYEALFRDWLPYYRLQMEEPLSGSGPDRDVHARQKTLLRIMSTLDDTCVIRRVGAERAERVKAEAAELLGEIPGWTGHLRALCDRYAAEGISPGGAADMLALTIFMDSILTQ